MNNQFDVSYDDQPNEAVDSIDYIIRQYGLKIMEIKSGDGFIIYEVVKIEETNE